MKRRDIKPKRSAVNRHRGAVLKKAVGVLIATILIVGTVIGAVGKDNLFTMRAEAGTTHPIVAYIGTSGMTDEEREGNVHVDLDTFGDTITYDIMAYVTNDAEQVDIRVPLNEVLEFAFPSDTDIIRDYPVRVLNANGEAEGSYNALDAEIVPSTGDDTVPSFTGSNVDNSLTLYDVLECDLRDQVLEIRVHVTQPAAEQSVPAQSIPAQPAAEQPVPTQSVTETMEVHDGKTAVASAPSVQVAAPANLPADPVTETPATTPEANTPVTEITVTPDAGNMENAYSGIPATESTVTETVTATAVQTVPANREAGTLLHDGLRGNWLHFTFDAKIRELYAKNPEGAALLMDRCESRDAIVTDNGGVETTVNSHAGIKGKATYSVSPVPADNSQQNAYSNVVTAMPGKRSFRFYCRLEGGDGSDIGEADMLRRVMKLFVRRVNDPSDERDMTDAFDRKLSIKQDVKDSTRWEVVWTGIPVPDTDHEYVLRIHDPETETYSEEIIAGDGEPEITVGGYAEPEETQNRKMKARVLGVRSPRTAANEETVYAKIIWDGDENPNPPESVALTVKGEAENGTAVSDTVYTIRRDGNVMKAGETETDTASVVQVDEREWSVEIGGLPKETSPSQEEETTEPTEEQAETQTTEQSRLASEETTTGTKEDITYTIDAGSAEAKTGSYSVTKSGSGTEEDPYTVTYTYQAPATTVTMPAVSLNVNGASEAELKTMTEIVTYNITTTVPDDPNATLMTITDELKGGMQFAGTKGDVRVEVEENAILIDDTTELTDPDDASVTFRAIRTEDQKLTVSVPVDAYTRGKQVQVSFRAAIKDGITYEALAAVYKDAKIPNEAESFAGTFSQPKMGTAKSSPVTIQPVSALKTEAEAGDITLTVNGQSTHADLAARDDLFTYLIETTVPEGARSVLITDTFVPVLKNMSGQDEIVVKLGDKIITPSTEVVENGVSHKAVTVDGQTVQVRVPFAEDDKDAGKKVTVQLKAVIRSDMDLSGYESAGGKIPNEASIMVDGDPEKTGKSNQVTVKAPEGAGVTKTVNGKETYTLEEDSDALSYSITARIPLDAETYMLTDTVPDVLIIKSASAKVGGRSMGSANLKRKGQDVYLTLPDATDYAGDSVEMKVNTKLVQGADLALYNNHKVPNTVTVTVNGRVYETSEPATVDGEVLGMRRRGGQTGEESEIPRLIVIVCALIVLIVLARHRVDY